MASGGVAGALLVAVVAGLDFNFLTLCQRGDPGDVALTAEDVLVAYHGEFGQASIDAVNKIQQWFTHLMFPVWCNCSDGSIPPPNTVTPPPAESPNPGMPSGVLGTTCWDMSQTKLIDAGRGGWIFNSIVPPAGAFGGQPDIPINQNIIPTPAPLSITFTTSIDAFGAAPSPGFIDILFGDINGANLPGTGFLGPTMQPGGPATTAHIPVPTAAHIWTISTGATNGNAATNHASGRFEMYCTGSPSAVAVPCCPPDEMLEARLGRIEGLEEVIIKLLGQQLRGHIDGSRHANLTGAGSVTLIDSVSAIRVEVTSSLASWPHNPGDPNYYISLGFITSIAAGSPLKGWRLVYASQTFPIVDYADQIGYTLPAGVSIDLVELLPAP